MTTTQFTKDAVRTELVNLFQAHASEAGELTESSHLVADLGIDSLGVMEVIADVEDKFALHVPDEALRDVNTVGDVIQAIQGRLQTEGRLAE